MSIPHGAQTAGCISRWPPPNPPPPPPYPPPWFRRADRQAGQRLGSLVNPLELKNSCSPAVKVNTAPQSLQVRSLSEIAIRIASDSVVLVQSRSSDVAETLTCTCADSTRYVQAAIDCKEPISKSQIMPKWFQEENIFGVQTQNMGQKLRRYTNLQLRDNEPWSRSVLSCLIVWQAAYWGVARLPNIFLPPHRHENPRHRTTYRQRGRQRLPANLHSHNLAYAIIVDNPKRAH